MDEDTRIINYCTCCPFWKRSPSLVFDYSEIDDAEFESQFTSSMATPLLSNHRHTPTLPQPTQSLHSLTLSSSALVSPGIWTGFASLFRGSTARGLHPHHHHHHHHTQHQHQHIQSSGRAGRQIPPPASLSLSLEDGGGSGRGYLGVASDARLLSREEVDSLTSSYLQQDQMEISSKGGLASLRDVRVEEMLYSLEAASLSAADSRVSPNTSSAEAEVVDELEKRRPKRDGGQVDHPEEEEEEEDLDQDLLGLLIKAASTTS